MTLEPDLGGYLRWALSLFLDHPYCFPLECGVVFTSHFSTAFLILSILSAFRRVLQPWLGSNPQAVEKLTAKLKSCEELQETMKGVNAYWRKTGTCMGAPGITEQLAAKLDNKITNATVSWERLPFSLQVP